MTFSISRRSMVAFLIGVMAFLAFSVQTNAQYSMLANKFIKTYVLTDPSAGRFYMATEPSGPAGDEYKFLYGSGPDRITSNIVFRVSNGSSSTYYCNVPNNYPWRPKINGVPAEYKQFDSLYTSRDTIAMGYKGMSGYNVTVRLVMEKPQTPYDDGGDMLIEFSAEIAPFAPPSSLGIFMMLDAYNGQASGSGGQGDKSSILTNRGYFPVGAVGKIYTLPFDTIPDFYHVGNFTMEKGPNGRPNELLPIHRMRGLSQGGAQLTTPEMFAVGDWRSRMREYGWDVVSTDVGTVGISDCATIVRWANIRGGETVRTAFGLNNRGGNNMFHCRDTGLFVDIRSARVVEQRVKNGVYAPTSFDVDMWVTNLDESMPLDVQVVIDQPIMSNQGPNRLTLDASTAASQSVQIPKSGQRKLRWRLNFNPLYSDDSANVTPQFRYKIQGKTGPRLFKYMCNPTITIKKFIDAPPPVDDRPPVIARGATGRAATAFWNFATYDRHPGFRYDTGLDRIMIEYNDLNNIRLTQTPTPFRRCDTNITVGLLAEVVDTTRPGRIIFSVLDCRGNLSRDSAIYNPRPDRFQPTLVRIDSSGTYGPPCNNRLFDVYVIDSLNQTADAGDNGLGRIDVLGTPVNFKPLRVNVERGEVAIGDFERRASFQVEVADTMLDASITVRYADYAGNADTITFDYCTLPDIMAPRAMAQNLTTESWTVSASDTLAWDRGLESVVVLSNLDGNMDFTPPAITVGQRTASWDVWVRDNAKDAEIVFEIRDTRHAGTPDGHADTITLRFSHNPDTLAPNIVFTPVPGSNGAVATVEVNDIHYNGTEWYKFDLGLGTIRVSSITANIRVSPSTPITFSPGDSITTFQVEVIDTLAFGIKDTICLEATDLAGNQSGLCFYYPINPDTRAPIFTGEFDTQRTAIQGTASDDRLYDRGLGSVTIENPVNIDPNFLLDALNGVRSTSVAVNIPDPTLPVSGILVVRDLVSLRDLSAEAQAIHAVRIPFSLPTVGLRIDLPKVVELDGDIIASVVVTDTFPGSEVGKIDFELAYNGNAAYQQSSSGKATVSAIDGGGTLRVTAMTNPGVRYSIGDVLGTIQWKAKGGRVIEEFRLSFDPSTLRVNDGLGSVAFAAPKPGDTAVSHIRLPPIFARLNADSLTYINGECERVLTTTGRAAKLTGLAILGIRPLPISRSSGNSIEIDLRQMPREGARAELVAANGVIVERYLLSGHGDAITQIKLPLPEGIPSGAYFLRIYAAGENDWTKVMVVQ